MAITTKTTTTNIPWTVQANELAQNVMQFTQVMYYLDAQKKNEELQKRQMNLHEFNAMFNIFKETGSPESYNTLQQSAKNLGYTLPPLDALGGIKEIPEPKAKDTKPSVSAPYAPGKLASPEEMSPEGGPLQRRVSEVEEIEAMFPKTKPWQAIYNETVQALKASGQVILSPKEKGMLILDAQKEANILEKERLQMITQEHKERQQLYRDNIRMEKEWAILDKRHQNDMEKLMLQNENHIKLTLMTINAQLRAAEVRAGIAESKAERKAFNDRVNSLRISYGHQIANDHKAYMAKRTRLLTESKDTLRMNDDERNEAINKLDEQFRTDRRNTAEFYQAQFAELGLDMKLPEIIDEVEKGGTSATEQTQQGNAPTEEGFWKKTGSRNLQSFREKYGIASQGATKPTPQQPQPQQPKKLLPM